MSPKFLNKKINKNSVWYNTFVYINFYRILFGVPVLLDPPNINLYNFPNIIDFKINSNITLNELNVVFKTPGSIQWNALVWASPLLSPGVSVFHNYKLLCIDQFDFNESFNIFPLWSRKFNSVLKPNQKIFIYLQFIDPNTCFRSPAKDLSIILS